MTAESPVPVQAPPPKKSRVATIVRWAVRLTSLPILALALVSLIPTLVNFGVSAKDDKIIALGLGAISLGFILGWKWSGVAGVLSLAGVGVVMSQNDSPLSADPFSIAFALQGLLFLISAVLNLPPGKTGVPAVKVIKWAGAGLLAICAVAGAVIICRGPAAMPVPKEKERYVGVWDNNAGFRIEITKSGEAKVTQDKDAKVDPSNTPVRPGETKVFNATFRSDDCLELASSALSEPKTYHIDRRPHPEGKQIKMTLNCSDPYKRSSGFVLVKREDKK